MRPWDSAPPNFGPSTDSQDRMDRGPGWTVRVDEPLMKPSRSKGISPRKADSVTKSGPELFPSELRKTGASRPGWETRHLEQPRRGLASPAPRRHERVPFRVRHSVRESAGVPGCRPDHAQAAGPSQQAVPCSIIWTTFAGTDRLEGRPPRHDRRHSPPRPAARGHPGAGPTDPGCLRATLTAAVWARSERAGAMPPVRR